MELCLAFSEFDFSIREDKPVSPAVGATRHDESKKMYDFKMKKWERSNHLEILVMNLPYQLALLGSPQEGYYQGVYGSLSRRN